MIITDGVVRGAVYGVATMIVIPLILAKSPLWGLVILPIAMVDVIYILRQSKKTS